ncbi:putative arsenite efflux transporter ArsB-like protein [Rhexocercosporidium sp. MPI-PUGE-AT-0058]|nr:putative arsenite efflux transporter ArsB-like protein [Rhexocercosporidium sp. MPI-PUGE-AT-0058]
MADVTEQDLDTGKIKEWRSIVTLIAFVITNVITLFPFHVPIYLPRRIYIILLDMLSAIRVIPPRQTLSQDETTLDDDNGKIKPFVRFRFPLNFLTAPLIADLFLLAISAIGREEVHDGTIGANHISPIDIMVFFITLAYIAISIDASGLIRYLAFKVLQRAGKVGHRLFFYLYAFFFLLGSFIGNDPIILSGTAFLAYMTRVSSNIVHPRAWIFSQFAIANIASAILVSSNPTNLVLAGAFQIKFIDYTANMIVPVVITAIVLFPFLLYIVFADESLIPISIKMHELSDEAKARKPVNPNIPHGRGNTEDEEAMADGQEGQLLSLEEIMNPFLDKGGAAFGAVIMTATLVTLLALNAASQSKGEHPVFWVTLPAAFVMFCWDVGFGWYHRKETREIARKGRAEVETARAERALREEEERQTAVAHGAGLELSPMDSQKDEAAVDSIGTRLPYPTLMISENLDQSPESSPRMESSFSMLVPGEDQNSRPSSHTMTAADEKQPIPTPEILKSQTETNEAPNEEEKKDHIVSRRNPGENGLKTQPRRTTLVSLTADGYRWLQETFPTVTAVVAHLPFALVPFAFCMFVLVQALVTKGWVPVFAHGWDHWVEKTGTIGSIGGMAFLSVILCNFAGTNIGTTILLSRVIQTWVTIHEQTHVPISERTFWATVYSMAIGVNYGAFSTAFSASLAGLLWRDILARKHIHVRRLDFASVNLPIIAIAMAVGCAVLVGEVYIMRDDTPYVRSK